jgi:hemoglobin
MTKAFLEITLKIAPENRAQAGGVYKKYRQPFLSDATGAESKTCLRAEPLAANSPGRTATMSLTLAKEMKMKTLIKAIAAIAFMAGTLVAPVALAEQAAAKAPLYDRLGGLKGITLVVDDFINRLVVNTTLNSNPAINAGRESSPAPYLKFQVSQMICEATGGPCKYTGKGMKDSHAHLNITKGGVYGKRV